MPPLDMEAGDLEELEKISARRKVVAVGEIGLDYFRDRQPRPSRENVWSIRSRSP